MPADALSPHDVTMNATPTKTNLLGLTRTELEAFVAGMGEKPFRARQLMKWLYKRHVGDFDQMTDLAKSFASGSRRSPKFARRRSR